MCYPRILNIGCRNRFVGDGSWELDEREITTYNEDLEGVVLN